MEIADLIEKLQEATHEKMVLEAIWREIGPYGTGQITPDTLRELNKIMKWDDSE